jgi:hypothetical protein
MLQIGVDMRAISRARFDALAGYCRKPALAALTRELAWFGAENERILATLIIDTDGEFSGIILARDLLERFRWVGSTTDYFKTPEEALVDLNREVLKLLPDLEVRRDQGDETGRAVDFFTPVVDNAKLHPNFRKLAAGDEFSAAREIINAMMRWHEDVDGNFVEQFQTTGFDARLWELYLFATLVEANLEVSHPKPAPDLLARGLGGEFAVEATTINPSVGASTVGPDASSIETDEERKRYHLNYLPIRYAGPLTNKLGKRYWERPSATGKPLVIAIQDFHAKMSMTYSKSALPIYLYGLTHNAEVTDNGELIVTVTKIEEHRWGDKVVPSGFFFLPDAENISAVLFNSGGTISKFNRMGVCAGFGAENVVLIRYGHAWDPAPNAAVPQPFMHIVTEGYPETWVEGMDVYHNPNALNRLDPDLLPGAAHHRLREDGKIETTTVEWKPMASPTSIVTFTDAGGGGAVSKVAD